MGVWRAPNCARVLAARDADGRSPGARQVENVGVIPPHQIRFDFLGKDSIRYENSVEVHPKVYKAVEHFMRMDVHGKREPPPSGPPRRPAALPHCLPPQSTFTASPPTLPPFADQAPPRASLTPPSAPPDPVVHLPRKSPFKEPSQLLVLLLLLPVHQFLWLRQQSG